MSGPRSVRAAKPATAAPLRRALDGAALAVAFLTILPARPRADVADLRAAAPWFPLVGALVGGLAGATRYGAEPLFGATIASVLALAVLVVVTGALHQDGLADCADGLGVRGDRDRRLAVMRDPATGVFGTLALVGWALLLTAALTQLDDGEALQRRSSSRPSRARRRAPARRRHAAARGPTGSARPSLRRPRRSPSPARDDRRRRSSSLGPVEGLAAVAGRGPSSRSARASRRAPRSAGAPATRSARGRARRGRGLPHAVAFATAS